MERLELVEKLVAKTSVSYEDAKNALEACGWDILDAMVYLEKLGKIQAPKAESYSTQYEKTEQFEKAANAHSQKSSFTEMLNKFFSWCGEMIRKGNENSFNIAKNEKIIVTMPVTIFVIMLVCAFWVVVPLIVVGLFMGFKYSFSGNETEKMKLNGAMDKASEMAESLKKEFESKSEK